MKTLMGIMKLGPMVGSSAQAGTLHTFEPLNQPSSEQKDISLAPLCDGPVYQEASHLWNDHRFQHTFTGNQRVDNWERNSDRKKRWDVWEEDEGWDRIHKRNRSLEYRSPLSSASEYDGGRLVQSDDHAGRWRNNTKTKYRCDSGSERSVSEMEEGQSRYRRAKDTSKRRSRSSSLDDSGSATSSSSSLSSDTVSKDEKRRKRRRKKTDVRDGRYMRRDKAVLLRKETYTVESGEGKTFRFRRIRLLHLPLPHPHRPLLRKGERERERN